MTCIWFKAGEQKCENVTGFWRPPPANRIHKSALIFVVTAVFLQKGKQKHYKIESRLRLNT